MTHRCSPTGAFGPASATAGSGKRARSETGTLARWHLAATTPEDQALVTLARAEEFGAAGFASRGVVPAGSPNTDLETAERPATEPTVARPAVVGQPMKTAAA